MTSFLIYVNKFLFYMISFMPEYPYLANAQAVFIKER